MLNSARRNLSYPNPDRSDRPDIAAFFGNIIPALDSDVMYVQGTNAARLAAAHQANGGRFWWTTDTQAMWYDDGAAWWQVGPGTQVNTYANRPLANAVPPGTRFLASDTLGYWYSDGATWTLVNQGTPRVSLATFALAPFTTPYDLQKVALTIDATNGIYWIFQYNSGSGSAYKWEFTGGPELYSEITASEAPPAAYGNMTTVGPSVALPRAGDYMVSQGMTAAVNQGLTAFMSYDIGATAAVDADAVQLISPGGGGNGMVGTVARSKPKTGLTAVTLLAKYKGTAGGISQRWLTTRPVRIS